MKPISTSIYTFSDLMAGDYLYVDKTEQIFRLISEYKGQYFLSRPRRFGKSLLVSTLKAIFQGRRELFKGLWIDESEYDWTSYPVIHLDMGSCVAPTSSEFSVVLTELLDEQAEVHDLVLTNASPSARFRELVIALAKRDGKVVILVDEYDKPLLGLLGKPEVLEIQSLMKTFYGVIKTTEACQRFALITGVSKFTKVSIFSDLNNLTDLTMRRDTATLLGYTQEELEASFSDYIDALAAQLGVSRDAALAKLRHWYNGYRFHSDAPTVYNPVSVMKCFHELEFKNYWFETGTPTFLVDLIKKTPIELGNLHALEADFSAYEPMAPSPIPLLFQTGYMTLGNVEAFGDTLMYHLCFPNKEIEISFSHHLAKSCSSMESSEMTGLLRKMVRALQADRPDDMLQAMQSILASVDYEIHLPFEKYYQSLFYVIFKMIGAAIQTEVHSSDGRVDAILQTDTHVYIFEFKLNETAAAALKQIKDKNYALPYCREERDLVLIGASFDHKTRTLGDWLIESSPADQPDRISEDAGSYGGTLHGIPKSRLASVYLNYQDRLGECDQARRQLQSEARVVIREWAPLIRNVWQTWRPEPGEKAIMVAFTDRAIEARGVEVVSFEDRVLRTRQHGCDGIDSTDLNEDPAEYTEPHFHLPIECFNDLSKFLSFSDQGACSVP